MTPAPSADSTIDRSSVANSLAADEIAHLVGGTLQGDGATRVTAIAPLHRAAAGELSFLAAARYAEAAATCEASVVLVAPELAEVPLQAKTRIVVERPHEAVLLLLPRLHPQPARLPGVHATAQLGRGVRLGADVTIDAFAVIGDGAVVGDRCWIGAQCVVGAGVEVGDDSRLFPQVTCYAGTRIGARVLVHSGVRLGGDGFGYVFRDGQHAKIPHVGRCLIDDDVEIGANSTIDRGSVDDTRIGAGTKIDNLVQIGHNVRVGRLCLIMSQVGISGSTRIGDGCVLAGQAGIGGHLHVGAGARIAGQAGVFGDVPEGETWSGYPARPHRDALRASAALFKLPGMIRDLQQLLRDREAER